MKKPVIIASIVLGFCLASFSSVTAQINGSFENGSDPSDFSAVGPGQTDIAGWSVDLGSVTYIGTYWRASDGGRSIQLNGGYGGVVQTGQISQTLTTVPGSSYQVTFDLSGNPGDAPALKQMSVSTDGAANQYYQYITGTNTLDDMQWASNTYVFRATGSQTVLSFKSETGGSYGPALDNVRVAELTPTPTPTPIPTPTPQFSLTITKSGTGAGSVASGDGLVNCGATCSANYNTGTIVNLTATANGGSTFTGWGGSCSGVGTCSVTMSQARSVNAVFDPVSTPESSPSPTPSPTGTVLLGAEMNGGQVVPSTKTAGAGLVVASLNKATNKLTIATAFGPFNSKPTSAHIHGPATLTQNGPVLFDIGPIISSKLFNKWFGVTNVKTITLTAAQTQQLLNGQFYVDVHTSDFANGEIRGKIVVLLSLNSPSGYSQALRPDGSSSVVLHAPDSLLASINSQLEGSMLSSRLGNDIRGDFRQTNGVLELSEGVQNAVRSGNITSDLP